MKLIDNINIATQTLAYVNFLYAKERAGLERATANAIFVTSMPTQIAAYNKFLSLITEQEAFVKLFKNFANKDDIAFYDNAINDKSFNEVQKMRDILIAKYTQGEYGVPAKTWFDTITQKIDVLKMCKIRL
ncbi:MULTISPECIES: nitrate- and nitrite sensing domain-containing protein [unclassified Campylobacter]|uniref:nitrate- and nitrite sensing domain-containing protein n=1 Tax=unclassified Campylobacter TaxID=2593542 RepID=UPI001237A4B9|nr:MULTISPECIES: nitrate- and nitrite sensing domain-containing protein [unclassified Campylobacter]KAA6225886.1 hypothetical protein FMM54_05550 [Campylobacter sp. LR185c]KAA6227010.1 hypothetical protein FMM55_03405 [Campylobacter sp. LR196d]KAA6227581.1 hypothetical protein FMM57_03950 [Campylobacter sp. LR286c]KAA6230691.1 hypothetical protein FMM58_04580 [Campylobacter sp. LR291e]KAA8604992.1 hypothetical protein CGP82_01080 [Campylobacter sp. LR185c]